MYFWRKPINVSPSHRMARLLKQPSLVYVAFHSVERSINVLSTWICLHLPYSEFYHKHISHENQRKEPQKIKATFYRYILLVAVSFSQLRKPICSILLDWNRYFILWRPSKEDLHILLIPVPLLNHHSHPEASYQISLCSYRAISSYSVLSGDKTAGCHLFY